MTVNPARRAEVRPARLYSIHDANRWTKVRLAFLVVRLLWITLRERPDVAISSGAAPGYIALRLAKLMGARVIWVDSLANAEHLSLSGKLIGRHADLWLTQWPQLAERGGPHYGGAVF